MFSNVANFPKNEIVECLKRLPVNLFDRRSITVNDSGKWVERMETAEERVRRILNEIDYKHYMLFEKP